MNQWSELIIRLTLVISLFFYLLSINTSAFPVVELALIVVISAIYYLRLYGQSDKHWESEVSNRNEAIFTWIYVVLFAIICYFLPYFYVFLPVLFYDIPIKALNRVTLVILFSVLGLFLNIEVFILFFIGGLSLICAFLHALMLSASQQQTAYFSELNSLRHVNERFKQEQQHLVALQDDRIQSSINNERRRIVGEIHDILGHQLSSVIIQLGALEYVVEDEQLKLSLREIKEVLNTSMTNVRAVIHTERESTIDLESEIQHLIDGFTKAPVHYTYSNESPLDTQTAHSMVNIVKEALTNINKHSNATHVTIRFLELPTQWSLLISDNGSTLSESAAGNPHRGIGLLNIEERVHQLDGNIHINHERGFRIFITIPKTEDVD
ncbi:sensor histidine kinase [Fundicoccus culcitae]|uniref:histidine kinase n=1 Tax=Fundicoccus culcitae TaxID=2969821 RepID=A0ABY5P229_9LACT|nr:histidine kinase [Fundicoccus culcitae]UUX32756.1 histidine kinase [Fundicoccus culcitae]